jgi:DNA polymerase/3'-5' exonuclease PolX
MKLERAQEIADQVIKRLYPYCQRIKVAGSVRRQKPEPSDIELLYPQVCCRG